jgi:type IV pilus assembly protein PilW
MNMPSAIRPNHIGIQFRGRHAQRGVTLIEMMVGITLGLVVVAVATAALMVSRGISGTVSDASNIQQQAAYALRVIGSQLRQTGSLYLTTRPTDAAGGTDPAAKVGFQIKVEDASDTFGFDLDQPRTLLFGKDGADGAGDTLIIGFRRHQDPVFVDPSGGGATSVTLARNCWAGPSDTDATASGYQLVQSVFDLDATAAQLRCAGNGVDLLDFAPLASVSARPVVDNVADFQVRYLVQDMTVPDTPKVRYLDAGSVANWATVQGVEVCLVLYGDERIDLPTGSKYTDCNDTEVELTTLAGARQNRMHLVFRNVFQLRSMGAATS